MLNLLEQELTLRWSEENFSKMFVVNALLERRQS